MSSQRAHSIFQIKSVDTAQRIIEGIASTPTPDRGGDVMEPKGAQFVLPMPFLWMHRDPIGEIFAADVRPNGIYIKARISKLAADAPDGLKARIDEAWHSISATPPLARGLSIGWKGLEYEPIRGTTFTRFLKWIWGETSAVVVPMNREATILSVKHFDQAVTASGHQPISTPGVSGSPRKITSMNASEQLQTEQALLQTKSTRFAELMEHEQQHGGLEADETTERDTLQKEIDALAAKVARLKTLEAAQASQATAITFGPSATVATPTTKRVELVHKEYPKGTHFVRTALAIAAGKGSYSDTIAYAKRFTDMPELVSHVKHMLDMKSVEGTSVLASPGWGSQLVNPDTAQTEFVELLMPQTIIGQVPNFRRVPFNIPIITQTGGSTFNWVGESQPKPVGEMAFTRTTMGYTKCAGIIVMSEELTRLSRPNSEALARQDMIDQCRKFLDEQFIQVGVSASATNPASITNGVASPAASGSDADALKADLAAALATFTGASIPLTGLVIVTTPEIALGISLLTTTLGQAVPGFNVTPTGGTLLGYQVIVSESVDAGTLVIFKPSEIFLADDGQVRLDASNQATLDMSGGNSPSFSLWQNNCVGLRAERWINYQKRRSDVVAVIDTASYGPSVGSP